jgi:DNA-binding transcriptional ArsR family regulator
MPANRLLPGRSSSVERGDGSQVVSIQEDAADEVFEALSSRTAREILAALYEDPDTASSVADRVDTSLQNASYHIEKLVDADLVEVADTWYSEQGREMKVYAPASDSLVVFASDEATSHSLRERLLRLLGAVGVLGIASVAVQRLLGEQTATESQPTAADGGGGGGDVGIMNEPGAEATTTTADQADTVYTAAESAAQGLPPGLVFFAGGLLALTVVLGYAWYRSR